MLRRMTREALFTIGVLSKRTMHRTSISRRRFKTVLLSGAVSIVITSSLSSSAANSPTSAPAAKLQWIAFPDPRIEVRGLPWFQENAPELWRLPKRVKDTVPKAVWSRAVASDGGRLRFASSTTHLGLRVQLVEQRRKPCFFDAYANGHPAGSAGIAGREAVELVLFKDRDRTPKEITVYLPNNQSVRVLAVSVDADAGLKAPSGFALRQPLVCYGSSVLQGTGADHPAKTYPATLARLLNLDFVNLGFGGAGKAETNVVRLVNQLDACAFLFDLGKSYGAQPPAPYARMLDEVRAKHPTAPIFCVTPIYSTKEAGEPPYRERSENLRALMRRTVAERVQAGDRRVFVVEGLELFGEADKDAFNDPLHPNDEGNERMAQRLAPIVRKALFGEAASR